MIRREAILRGAETARQTIAEAAPLLVVGACALLAWAWGLT
jgi:hypothetical protein